MVSQVYLDVVGEVVRGDWLPSYNSVIMRPCECGAAPWMMCTNPLTGSPRRAPCRVRFSLS
jgi:hypothetical protein